MAKRIRKRFILLAMAALAVTLVLTFLTVYAVLYNRVTTGADEIIWVIANNGWSYPVM